MRVQIGTRRVQKLGDSSFINLPAIWTKQNGIRKGDKVGIEMQEDGSLKISPIQGGA